METFVRDRPEDAAATAADHIAEALLEAVTERGQASLAVSGGRTPVRMFEELSKLELPWDVIDVFQVDERLARESAPERNLTVIRDHLLAHVPVRAGRLHPMPVGVAGLADAARRYEETLVRVAGSPPVLDVVHLGLGADGHTASLVPEDAALTSEHDVAAVAEYEGFRRLTLTFPAINRARRRVLLVTGAGKAVALAALMQGSATDIPAAGLERDRTVLVADREAALGLG